MPKRMREPGEFCWINIITPDVAKSQAFFTGLLGWTFPEMPGMGHLVMVGDSRIGGMFDLNGPQTPPGTPPVIGVMVKVKDCEATAKKVAELGGRAKPPMDIGPNGRMVECYDPSGANFDLWEPKAQAGSDVDGALEGAFSWFECYSKDGKRDSAFYQKLFGWKPEIMPMPGFDYITFAQGENRVAGMMDMGDKMPGVAPQWAVYFTVTDIEKSVQKASKLGGEVWMPINPVPNVGRFAGLLSPQGLRFFVMQYDRR